MSDNSCGTSRVRDPLIAFIKNNLLRPSIAALSWSLGLSLLTVALAYLLRLSEGYADAAVHGAMVSVSVASAWWLVILLVDFLIYAPCLIWTLIDGRKTAYTENRWRAFILGANRQVTNSWAILCGLMVSMLVLLRLARSYPGLPKVPFILVSIFSLSWLGPLVGTWLGALWARRKGLPSHLTKSQLLWLRRPFYLLTTAVAIGFFLLFAEARHHPLVRALALVVLWGNFVRSVIWLISYRQVLRDIGVPLKATGVLAKLVDKIYTPRCDDRERAIRDAESTRIEIYGPRVNAVFLSSLIGIVLIAPQTPLFAYGPESELGRNERVSRNVHRQPTSVRLSDEEVDVFLFADNQFKALNGSLSMGQSPMIDAIVPVAVRPVELDLLSGATVARFARLYRRALQDHPGLRWAHLGDFSDLACRSELDRMNGVVAAFGGDSLAGLVPGNHDSFFAGNFAWHPDWDVRGACPGGGAQRRLGTEGVNERLLGWMQRSRDVLETTSGQDDFLARIVKLGNLGDGEKRRLLGVFLDTADYHAWLWLGAAGAGGAISGEQANWVTKQLSRILDEGHDDRVVIFQHHPIEDLSAISTGHYRKIVMALGTRLLAVVSAHTHSSEPRETTVGNARIRQFVVGSTTDPPAEAAMLSVGMKDGQYVTRFSTIPAVDNGGLSASQAGPFQPLDGAKCAEQVRSLGTHPDCKALFVEQCPRPSTLERQRAGQQERARALLECKNPAFPRTEARPLADPNPYRWLGLNCPPACVDSACNQLANDDVFQDSLVCLGWAASTYQGHKKEGWCMGHAMALAFDPLASASSWSHVAP